MSYQKAVEKWYEYHSQSRGVPSQPSQWASEQNRRGWHLYNSNGYLGSVNRDGEVFFVKSRGGES